ncbi:unnamed protein product [Tuber melanosporum]|uniref:(Perigord truffle) hypothetical protein n=1 Tax=Tuber melanosporum (strain Mel28) TaxID=656061 RepID=D5GJL2_TUBMM|nr:uncharacterized protein GSTUM_00009063001 [Tuber melanosporum]CAZ84705.1 unnamed protein product [Tuber melanosporum]
MTSKLLALPTDILISIIVHLPTASCLTHLSQTCKSLHAFISAEGWRVFVQCQHAGFHAKVTKALPHGKPAPTWNRWAEELTVTRSNWDNFGFLASGLFVEGKWRSRRKKKEEERRLGLQRRAREDACVPVIDLWEEWAGGEEVLVVGAGVNMMVRKRRRHGRGDGWWRYEGVGAGAGAGAGSGRRDMDGGEDEGTGGVEGGEGGEEPTLFEIFNAKHRADYLRSCRDSQQDYTTVHLLGSQGRENAEIAVVGRASGALEMVKLTTGPGRAGRMSVLGRFETSARKSEWSPRMGKYTSILPYAGSGDQHGLMSAGARTGLTSRFALYRVRIPSNDDFRVTPEAPVSEVEMSAGDGDIWSTNLLSPEYLAVTKTNSHESPLCVYAIAPDGIRKRPMMSFPDPFGFGGSTDATATARLESFAGEFPSGQVFLSAWSGGDLRYYLFHYYFAACT